MAKRSIEPLPWLLFTAGGVMSALFLPALVLLFGLAFPLGWISAPPYADVHGLLRGPLTLVVLFGVFTLSLFHWAHRFRFTLYDGLQIRHLNTLVAIGCYGGAAVGSVVAAYLLTQLRF
ncbi:MAG: fumarate reductase subunit FrdD [Actinomycetes bacterium]